MDSGSGENKREGIGRRGTGRVALLTIASLIAFAGNSILCRLALLPGPNGDPAIDALGFTGIRLLSGALILAPLLLTPPRSPESPGLAVKPRHALLGSRALSVALLAVYACAFSLSYVTIPAGVGALLLFGLVQVTMIGTGLLRGERLGAAGWVGTSLAIAGVVVLVAPSSADLSDSSPDPVGAGLMAIAGVAWGGYSLMGRGSLTPARDTAANFLGALPIAGLALLLGGDLMTWRGVALAATAGAVTSGLGYALWYAALRGHSATSAAIVQLTVPILAAAGGALWVAEPVTPRLIYASVLVLGGVALVLGSRRP